MHARRTRIGDARTVLAAMAEATAGFSGAELANLVNEAVRPRHASAPVCPARASCLLPPRPPPHLPRSRPIAPQAIAAVRAGRDEAHLEDFRGALEQYRTSRAPPPPGTDTYGGGGDGGVASAGEVLNAWLQHAVRVAEGAAGGERARSVAASGGGGIEENE